MVFRSRRMLGRASNVLALTLGVAAFTACAEIEVGAEAAKRPIAEACHNGGVVAGDDIEGAATHKCSVSGGGVAEATGNSAKNSSGGNDVAVTATHKAVIARHAVVDAARDGGLVSGHSNRGVECTRAVAAFRSRRNTVQPDTVDVDTAVDAHADCPVARTVARANASNSQQRCQHALHGRTVQKITDSWAHATRTLPSPCWPTKRSPQTRP